MTTTQDALSEQNIKGSKNTQITGDNNKINCDSISNNIKQSITINFKNNSDEVISRVPEANKQIATEVLNIAEDLIQASSTTNNSEIKDRVVKKLGELSLLSYQVSSSPFTPPINKAQLMCDNMFKLSYRGRRQKRTDCILFSVNNKNTSWQCPGDTFRSIEGDQMLEILFLEYDTEKKSPVFHYKCKYNNRQS
jgi:hypothetical protein